MGLGIFFLEKEKNTRLRRRGLVPSRGLGIGTEAPQNTSLREGPRGHRFPARPRPSRRHVEVTRERGFLWTHSRSLMYSVFHTVSESQKKKKVAKVGSFFLFFSFSSMQSPAMHRNLIFFFIRIASCAQRVHREHGNQWGPSKRDPHMSKD